MNLNAFNARLLQFLQESPTVYHASLNLKSRLVAAGFREISEASPWGSLAPGRYVVQRQDSALIAFQVTSKIEALTLLGAHLDSPQLKIKVQPEQKLKPYCQTTVEVYGGALLNPWFDRDLSVAGLVYFSDAQGEVLKSLVDWRRPVAVIPSLAIHLDRNANENRSIHKQKDLPALWQMSETWSFAEALLSQLDGAKKILSYDLGFYDVQAPAYVGLKEDFIASARLDNLLSCFIATETLLGAPEEANALMALYDHEEVGSESTVGAAGNFLSEILQRIFPDPEVLQKLKQNSLFVSCDNAHALHPNYTEHYDLNHSPVLNGGPAIKYNFNQRYATTPATASRFIAACGRAQVPYQNYAVRSDKACGSTIGPFVSARLGIPTIDVGVPSLAMHSIRELVGSEDAFLMKRALLSLLGQ